MRRFGLLAIINALPEKQRQLCTDSSHRHARTHTHTQV